MSTHRALSTGRPHVDGVALTGHSTPVASASNVPLAAMKRATASSNANARSPSQSPRGGSGPSPWAHMSRVQRKRMQQAPPQPERVTRTTPQPTAPPLTEPPAQPATPPAVAKKAAASPAIKDDGGEATGESRSKRGQIFEILVAHPERPIRDIAIDVYGKDTEQMRSNVRSQLDQMKRHGMARAVSPGKWRAIQPAEAPSE